LVAAASRAALALILDAEVRVPAGQRDHRGAHCAVVRRHLELGAERLLRREANEAARFDSAGRAW
jgi:hypothetical protein